MIKDIDQRIMAALDEEERHLIAEFDEFVNEPSYFHQAMSVFRGRTGWAAMVLMVVQFFLFVVGVWAAVHFFRADNALEALRWGIPAAVAILGSLVMKLSLWPQIHINRLEMQLKKLELLQLRQRGERQA